MKNKIIILTSLILAIGILSSCNELKKMTENAKDVNYKTIPNPLEMHAGKVAVKVSVTFPQKYFGKKVKLVISPFLNANVGSEQHKFTPHTLQGEKFQDNNEVIAYEAGGSYEFSDTLDYKTAFRTSKLEVKLLASTSKGKTANEIIVPLADGVITTPELVEGGIAVDNGLEKGNTLGMTVIVPISKPQISVNYDVAKLYFALQQSNVKPKEIKKEEIDKLIQSVLDAKQDPNKELKNIKIASYASPDGPEELNQGLVEKRGASSKAAFERKLKKAEIEENTEFLMTETTPSEDWDGFKKLVEESDMEDKDLILRVLSMHSDPVVREKEIKNIAEAYEGLKKDILPLLRRSIIKFEYQSKARTDSELTSMAAADLKILGQEEFLYAASASDDFAKQERIYKAYLDTFPNDWKAWNNLGVALTKQGKLADAKTNFEKVLDLNENNPAAYCNLGALAMAEKDWDKAWDFLTKSEEAGCQSPSLGYNQGAILIMRAKYDEAVNKMSENTFNKCLALTLSGNNEGAVSSLNSMTNDYALFYYLKAVTAAKAKTEGDVFENLRIAVSKDEELKKYAKDDIEFREYFDKDDFKNIVE